MYTLAALRFARSHRDAADSGSLLLKNVTELLLRAAESKAFHLQKTNRQLHQFRNTTQVQDSDSKTTQTRALQPPPRNLQGFVWSYNSCTPSAALLQHDQVH